MEDRSLFRVASACAVIGGLLSFGNLLHPRSADMGIEATLRLAVDSPIWVALHFVLFIGLLFVVAALSAIAFVVATGPARTFARFGMIAAMVGGALFLTSVALDGIVDKHLADAWASSTGADRSVALRVADAAAEINFALFSVGIFVLLGVAPLLQGMALLRDARFSRWLPLLALVGGAGSLAVGTIQIFGGFSYIATNVLFPVFAFLLTIWLLGMGQALWRMSATGENHAPGRAASVPAAK